MSLGETKEKALQAYKQAIAAQKSFYQECLEIGKIALDDFKTHKKVIVLLGHYYVIHDTFFNLNIAKRLLKVGIPTIPFDLLPLNTVYEKSKAVDLAWKSNNRTVNAL
jgi:predicted nucleotide-binding protein (sugar kinase/HSP70/actin superfamily)